MSSPVALTSVGLITQSVTAIDELAQYCSTIPDTIAKQVETIPPPEGMNARELRRVARLTKLALYAADSAVTKANLKGTNGTLYLGLTHGSTSLLQEFHDYLFNYGPRMASPNAFSNGVTNAPLGAVSKLLGLTHGGATLVGYENNGLEVLHYAVDALEYTGLDFALAGTTEEYSPLIEDAYKAVNRFAGPPPEWLPLPDDSQGYSLSEGSVFFTLCSNSFIAGNQETPYCLYTPLDSIDQIEQDIDIIISGAGGGAQDAAELDALTRVVSRQSKPPAILFSKCFFGETFACGAMLSAAMAWDILVNKSIYHSFTLHDSLNNNSKVMTDLNNITSILVIAGNRENRLSMGLFADNDGI